MKIPSLEFDSNVTQMLISRFELFVLRRMQSVVELGRTCRERRKVGAVPRVKMRNAVCIRVHPVLLHVPLTTLRS